MKDPLTCLACLQPLAPTKVDDKHNFRTVAILLDCLTQSEYVPMKIHVTYVHLKLLRKFLHELQPKIRIRNSCMSGCDPGDYLDDAKHGFGKFTWPNMNA